MFAATSPHEALAQLVQIRFDDTDLRGVCSRIVDLAKGTLPGAGEVSITLIRNGNAHTAAFTGALAVDLDETQYEEGHGPCMEAAEKDTIVHVPFMAGETRWSTFTARAVERGAYSSLSVGMCMQDNVRAALNIYGLKPDAFDGEQRDRATAFARHAAAFLANANLYDTAATLAQQMREAMSNRAVIEQAKGIVMRDRRCTPDEAFAVLARLSQDTNRRLRDIAAALVADATAYHSS